MLIVLGPLCFGVVFFIGGTGNFCGMISVIYKTTHFNQVSQISRTKVQCHEEIFYPFDVCSHLDASSTGHGYFSY